jgi:energy-converting hydrogenase Eha subunit C
MTQGVAICSDLQTHPIQKTKLMVLVQHELIFVVVAYYTFALAVAAENSVLNDFQMMIAGVKDSEGKTPDQETYHKQVNGQVID